MQNNSFGKNILHGIRSRLGKMVENPYRKVNISLARRLYYKHLTPGKLRKHRLFGRGISYVSSTELLHGLKEIFIEEVYKQELPARPYIIDCGANIGLSVIYLKRLFPDAEIIAFEPDEQNFRLLQENIHAFGYAGIIARKEAVWIKNEMMSFSGKGSTESKLLPDSDQPASVNAIRLKEIVNRKVDFLKIDIEGAEYAVINDLRESLHFVQHLFLEYHGNFNQNDQLNEIFSILTGSGFSYYIKEAASVYNTPFYRTGHAGILYDLQLNIFCFR